MTAATSGEQPTSALWPCSGVDAGWLTGKQRRGGRTTTPIGRGGPRSCRGYKGLQTLQTAIASWSCPSLLQPFNRPSHAIVLLHAVPRTAYLHIMPSLLSPSSSYFERPG